MNTIPRIGIYVRVSTEVQEERGSIEAQVEFGTKYCDLHGLPIAAWYKDDGVTGTLPLEDRPGGSQLLLDARNGIINTLLIYKLDRFGRNARIILNGIHALEEMGVKVRSMTEPFDTSDPAGRFTLTILAGVADLERDTILTRLWTGANRAARDGKWVGGITPYGYHVNEDGYLAVSDSPIPGYDLSEADVVRLVFNLTVTQKMSTVKISDYLNALNIPPKYTIEANKKRAAGKRAAATAGVWLPGRIRSMIVQTAYRGVHYYGKRTKKQREQIEREVPAIVDTDTWYQAQDVLADNRMEAMRNAKHRYLLRSLVKCGTCGLNYSGTYQNHSDIKYYVCNGKITYRGPYRGKCSGKSVHADWLDDMVWGECVRFINEPGQLISSDEPKNNAADLRHDLSVVEKVLESKLVEKHAILDSYRKKIITERDMEIQVIRIGQEESMLEAKKAEIKNALLTMRQMDIRKREAESMLSSFQNDIVGEVTFEKKRDIVKQIIKEVTVVTGDDPERDTQRVSYDVTFEFKKQVCLDVCRVVTCTDMDSSPPPA